MSASASVWPGLGDPDRDGHVRQSRGDGATHALQHDGRLLGRGGLHQHGELVAAHPVGAVTVTCPRQLLGDPAQGDVTERVAGVVVEALEVVDVDQGTGDGLAQPRPTGQRSADVVLEGSVVAEAREAVARRAVDRTSMPLDEGATAEEVEDRRSHGQAQEQHHQRLLPGVCQGAVDDRAVMTDVEHVGSAGQLHRHPELVGGVVVLCLGHGRLRRVADLAGHLHHGRPDGRRTRVHRVAVVPVIGVPRRHDDRPVGTEEHHVGRTGFAADAVHDGPGHHLAHGGVVVGAVGSGQGGALALDAREHLGPDALLDRAGVHLVPDGPEHGQRHQQRGGQPEPEGAGEAPDTSGPRHDETDVLGHAVSLPSSRTCARLSSGPGQPCRPPPASLKRRRPHVRSRTCTSARTRPVGSPASTPADEAGDHDPGNAWNARRWWTRSTRQPRAGSEVAPL